MDRARKCTAAYNDTILTFSNDKYKEDSEAARKYLELIRAEKERRGHGDSKDLMESGLTYKQMMEGVLHSFASAEQAKCNKNPDTYTLYGGYRKTKGHRKGRRAARRTKKTKYARV